MVCGETFLINFKFYAKTLTKLHNLTVLVHMQVCLLRLYLKVLTVTHRVHSVLGLFSSRPNWDHPPPHLKASVSPPFGSGGRHTRLRKRGWGVPIQTRGQTLWYSIGKYVLCAVIILFAPDFIPEVQTSASAPYLL
jgi:hypothetical protein